MIHTARIEVGLVRFAVQFAQGAVSLAGEHLLDVVQYHFLLRVDAYRELFEVGLFDVMIGAATRSQSPRRRALRPDSTHPRFTSSGRTVSAETIAAIRQSGQESASSRVTLNVGGVRYETTIATLRSVPGNLLEAMFNEQHGIKPDEDGAYFLDRDGSHFKYVLEYMRDGTSALEAVSDNVRLLRALKREFGYFNIEPELPRPLRAISQAVYTLGGLTGEAKNYTVEMSMERYDPVTNMWTMLTPMPVRKTAVGTCSA